MAEYQEARKTEGKKDKPAPNVKAAPSSSAQNGVQCPNCGAANPEGALFCAECGFGLGQPLFCPNCGAPSHPGADICEACKAWLLDGQCKFCYAQISPDAAFCPECGNPKDGIPCPHCGKLSIFDFCPGCGKPLSEGAVKALEFAHNDPEAKAVLDALNEAASLEAELAQLEELIHDEPETVIEAEPVVAPPPARKSLFSDRQLSSITKTGQNRDAAVQRRIDEEERKKEEERKRAEEERRRAQEAKRRAEEERQRIAQALKDKLARKRAEAVAAARAYAQKTFSSHQEARCWHNARRHPDAVGWQCNAYGSIHPYPGGPNDCADPSHGGCDVFE